MARILVFSAFCLAISVIDAVTYRIPDAVLLCFLAVLLVLDRGQPYYFFFYRSLAASACFFLFILISRLSGGIGYGDVKFAAVLGYGLGLEKICPVLLGTALSALAVYGAGTLLFRWNRYTKLPFAPSLSLSSLAVLWEIFPGFDYENLL
jgi:prepilin signal peptidase PulO-like enzyme (type II secretory pathway)